MLRYRSSGWHNLLEGALERRARFVRFQFPRFLNEPLGLFRLFLAHSDLPISRLIGQTLANDAADGFDGPLEILDAEGAALIIPEIELGEVTMKVFLGAMLIDALHAALEDAEKAFDGIGVDRAASVLMAIMGHNAMLGEVPANRLVVGCFVGHQPRFAGKVLTNQRPDGADFEVFDDHAAGLAGVAVYQRQNLVLVGVAPALLLVLRLDGQVAANEGFVNLDGTATDAERGESATAHSFPDPVAHEPRSFEGDAQGAVQLVRADPLLARTNQEDGLKPNVQLDVARLEDGADLDGEWLAAVIALVHANAGALAFQLAAAIDHAAVRANAAIGPDARLDKLVCGFFIVKVGCREYGHDFDPFRVPNI